jgi:hypothetical protein
MRILAATLMVAAACGSPKSKHESAIVEEGSGNTATCCCKTIPDTAEKEIVPVYSMIGRMECSSKHGDCVDDVQCNGSQPVPSGTEPGPGTQTTGNGVPPPPDLPPSK